MLYDYKGRMFLLQTYESVCNTCGIGLNRNFAMARRAPGVGHAAAEQIKQKKGNTE